MTTTQVIVITEEASLANLFKLAAETGQRFFTVRLHSSQQLIGSVHILTPADQNVLIFNQGLERTH